jgi:hypothetical protein
MTNPELISFYNAYSRLSVRARRDDQEVVEIQYRKTSPYTCGGRFRVRIAFPDFVPTGTEEVGFDPRGVWVTTDRSGVAKMLGKAFRTGHITQHTLILMLAAIDDPDLKSKSSTGLDAGSGWVRMIKGEPKWGWCPMTIVKREEADGMYDPYDG